MSFEWKQLIGVARLLDLEARNRPTAAEAMLRSALSRIYYGAFGHARTCAVEFLDYEVKGFGDDHGALRAHLKKRRRGGDAQRLDSLRQWRNDADYTDDLPWDDTSAVVAEAIKLAERIFASLAPPTAPDA